MEACKHAIEKYRGGLPAVYNTTRYRETSPSFESSENNVIQEIDHQTLIKVEVDKQVAFLRNALIPESRSVDLTHCDHDADDINVEKNVDITISDSDGDDTQVKLFISFGSYAHDDHFSI